MDTGKRDAIVRCSLVALSGSVLLGVYTLMPVVSLLLQVAVFALAAFYVAAGGRLLGVTRPLGWAALAMAGMTALSTLFSMDRAASLVALGQWLSYGLAGWLAASVFRPVHLRLLMQCLLLLGVLMGGLAVYFFWGETGRVALPVMNSIFGNKNHYGGYLLLLLPLSLALYLDAGSRRDRLAYALVTVFLSATFVLTYSRGAWFSIVPALALVTWVWRGLGWRLAGRLAAVGAAVLAVTFLITRGGVGSTIDLGYQGALSVAQAAAGGEAQGTLAPRLDYWQGAVRIMFDNPLVGTGPGTYAEVFPSYEVDPRFYSRYAHNFFLQIGAEAGIPGLLASLALFGVLAHRWVCAYRRNQAPSGVSLTVRAGLMAGLAASVLHNLVELDWFVPAIGLLFAMQVGIVLTPATRQDVRIGGPFQARPDALPQTPDLERPYLMNLLAWSRPLVMATFVLLLVLAGWQWAGQFLLARAGSTQDAGTAEARLEAAARLNPLDGEPDFRLAELRLAEYESSGTRTNLNRAIASAEQATARSPGRAAYRLFLARLYLEEGNLEGSIVQLDHLVSRLPPLHVPEAYRRLGEAYLRSGRTADAKSVYLRLLAGFPQGVDTPQPVQPGALTTEEASDLLAEAHLGLGNIYARERELGAAEQEYLQSLTLKPDSAAASFNLGAVYYTRELWDEALSRFDRASALDPRHAPTFYFRGLTRLKLSQREAAAADFRAALAIDPEYENARLALERL